MQQTKIINNGRHSFLCFPNDFIARKIIREGCWEPHFHETTNLVKPNSTVLDIGANFGYNSIVMADRVGQQGKILCFEPQRLMFQQLNANIALNNIFNCYTYNLALSNEVNQTLHMEIGDETNIGATCIGSGGEQIKTTTIDELNLDKLDFIKMDAQGYEPFILEGGTSTIQKFMPDIFIEIEPPHLDKFDKKIDDVYEILDSFGYKIYKINNEWPFDHICTTGDEVEKLNLPLMRMVKPK